MYFQKTTIVIMHAGQLPESVPSSDDMLTFKSVHEMEIFIFSYERKGKTGKNALDCFLISY